MGVLDNYALESVVDGYYKPEWVRSYDFTKGEWGGEVDVIIPKITFSLSKREISFNKTDHVGLVQGA